MPTEFSAAALSAEGIGVAPLAAVRLIAQCVDEVLPTLAFLVYVAVEAAVIYGMLRWVGAV